ncbi:MAG TPA: tetratricopeptide repeat protein, partial [Anaeromyxobacteraceae bacterium]
WTGSLAEEIFELEHGADGGERAARLAARADLPPPAFLALGRWHKRRGDLDEAMRWYDRASEVGGRNVEVMVNVGNVKFLRGDVEGAKAAWLDAADRGAADVTALAAAHYNLAKLYLRQSALDQSNQARRRALQMDEEFVTRFGSDDDFGANRWILDVPVEHAQVQALAAADGTPRLAGEAVQSRLGGAVPPWLWPLGPLGLVAFLGLLTPLLARLRVSAACDRCGRPACPRCESLSGPLCGQCVNVFVRKGVVDARDQLRKEVQVRRHERLDRWTGRALALLSGGGGHLWRGEPVAGFLVILGMGFAAFVLVFWRGLVPPPHPSPYILGGKLAAVGPLGLVLYALAVRDAFRRD